jgi:glycosyltransferase involved in cell wall biosynthesis
MIEVGIDRQIFRLQKYGGISRYFAEIISSTDVLKSEYLLNVTPLFRRHVNHYLKFTGVNAGCKLPDTAIDILDSEPLNSASYINQVNKFDILHATYSMGIPYDLTGPILISNLNDMIPEQFPEFFPSGSPHANKIEWFEKSDIIVSISQASADALLDRYPRFENKIYTIHLCSHNLNISELCNATDVEPPVGGQYILYIGNRGLYKNALMLISAYGRSRISRQGLNLVFAGGGPPADNEIALLKSLEILNHVVYLQPTDSSLFQLYKNATAVVVPSLIEGFSLPLVESLHSDTPLICSDIPAHREVANDFGYFLNACDSRDWTEAFNDIESLKAPSKLLGRNKYDDLLFYYSPSRFVRDYAKMYLRAACLKK